jgi:hypothetical protein
MIDGLVSRIVVPKVVDVARAKRVRRWNSCMTSIPGASIVRVPNRAAHVPLGTRRITTIRAIVSATSRGAFGKVLARDWTDATLPATKIARRIPSRLSKISRIVAAKTPVQRMRINGTVEAFFGQHDTLLV